MSKSASKKCRTLLRNLLGLRRRYPRLKSEIERRGCEERADRGDKLAALRLKSKSGSMDVGAGPPPYMRKVTAPVASSVPKGLCARGCGPCPPPCRRAPEQDQRGSGDAGFLLRILLRLLVGDLARRYPAPRAPARRTSACTGLARTTGPTAMRSTRSTPSTASSTRSKTTPSPMPTAASQVRALRSPL